MQEEFEKGYSALTAELKALDAKHFTAGTSTRGMKRVCMASPNPPLMAGTHSDLRCLLQLHKHEQYSAVLDVELTVSFWCTAEAGGGGDWGGTRPPHGSEGTRRPLDEALAC